LTHTPIATTLGRLTVYLRHKNVCDAVEAAIIRTKSQVSKKKAKARLHANKMMDLEVAVQTELAKTKSELDGEIASYENRRGALKTYLQDQFRSRKLLRNGDYVTIPIGSDYRGKKKPYTLRMNPFPKEGKAPSNEAQIAYLKGLLYVMMAEDAKRPLEPTGHSNDAKLVRNLPVISEAYLNPRSTHLKQLQQETVAALAKPKDNPWYTRLHEAYLGKILWDGGLFRVFAIQYNSNKGRNVFPCWEATAEPVYKADDGTFLVHRRHQTTTADGSTKLLKSAEVGFALAEYSLGDEAEPVQLPFVDECHAKFLQREARQPSARPPARQRRQLAPAQEAPQPSSQASIRKRRQPHASQVPPPTPLRSSQRRRS
jgi:hypothetical protein